MRFGVLFASISALMIAHSATAQVSEVLVVETDTITYSYTPLNTSLSTTTTADNDPKAERKRLRRQRTVERNERILQYINHIGSDRTFERKFDAKVFGGPQYSQQTSLGLAVRCLGYYRLDRRDSVTNPSHIKLSGDISLTGAYELGVMGYNIFRLNSSRIDYDIVANHTPTYFWGIGYSAAEHNRRSHYIEESYSAGVAYRYSLPRNFKMGAALHIGYNGGYRFANINYIGQQDKSYLTTGIGAIAEYDTRDNIVNANKGVYISLEYTFYPRALGTYSDSFAHVRLIVDYFQPLWRGGTLAADLYGDFHSSDTPWTMLSEIGGDYRMRGYYEGRYRGNNLITLQVELRQHIYSGLKIAVWGAGGNIFSTFGRFDIAHTLPNWGAGLRWEFKNRSSVRFDYGFGRNTNGIVFSFNEAF